MGVEPASYEVFDMLGESMFTVTEPPPSFPISPHCIRGTPTALSRGSYHKTVSRKIQF